MCKSRASLAAATAKHTADEIEEDLATLGLSGVRMRSASEWLAHPQGKYLATTHPVSLKRTGNKPFALSKAKWRPLEGVKVIDITHVVSGPAIGRQLAEQGADVIHVRHPEFPFIYPLVLESGYGKRNIFLNYTEATDRAHLEKLIKEADILVFGYRADALERAGWTEEKLKELNPHLILLQIDGYGFEGPWKNHRGWEQLAQTCCGIVYEHSKNESDPHLLPVLLNDYLTGYLGALGAVTALIRREKEGGSWQVKVCLARTAMLAASFTKNNETPEPLTNDDLCKYAIDQETPNGIFTRIAPPVTFSDTPSMAIRPATLLGSSLPDITWENKQIYEKPMVPHYPSKLARAGKLRGVALGFGIEDRHQ